MATITKANADKLIEKCNKQKRPIYYCIVSYWNTFSDATNYAYAKDGVDYDAICGSPVVANVEVLWASERFKKDQQSSKEPKKVSRQQSLADSMRQLINDL